MLIINPEDDVIKTLYILLSFEGSKFRVSSKGHTYCNYQTTNTIVINNISELPQSDIKIEIDQCYEKIVGYLQKNKINFRIKGE